MTAGAMITPRRQFTPLEDQAYAGHGGIQMSKAVAVNADSVPSPKPDAEVRGIIDNLVCFWPDDGSPLELRRELADTERGKLQLRARDLHSAMRPINSATEDKRRLAQALAAMFLGFPSMRNSDNQATVSAYIMAMEGFPLFAGLAACDDIMKRRVPDLDPDFPPTAPRMCDIAAKHTNPAVGERLMIERTLAGKTREMRLSPEERDRVGRGLRQVADAMNADLEIERQERKRQNVENRTAESQQAILAEYARRGLAPVYADRDKTILLSLELAGTRAKKKATKQ